MTRPKAHQAHRPPASGNLHDPSSERAGDDYTSLSVDHLLNLDKLLNAAHDIMKQEPTLDREAFEHLRRLRVKVRFAISSASFADRASVAPKQAPRRWKDRTNDEIHPLEFLVETYKPWLDAKIISRADVRRVDRALILALSRAGVTGEQLDAVSLPSKSSQIDQELRQAGIIKAPSRSMRADELSDDDRKRLRLYETARSRRRRPHTL